MGLLDDTSFYLCGQVENDPDAHNWRVDLAKNLININPYIKVWDPLIKPDWLPHKGQDDVMAFEWKKYITASSICTENNLNKANLCLDANRYIRHICKQLASKVDIIIARIPKIFTWGSIDELEIGIRRKIPIFLWLPDGMISVYGVSGIVDTVEHVPYYLHDSEESLLDVIKRIDANTIALPAIDPERWLKVTWPNSARKNTQ